ncbi:MAG TPA: hypothetical protein VGR73_15205 [Bryobacteraceae bacterium]|nr:hypothetical protein [Bryobacteraceae bacterium]
MKVRKLAGLVGAGGVGRSFLARMPALLERLGPVKGTSLRVARRIANGLKAGHGVAGYAALEPCELIWLAVPEASLDSIGAELAGAISLEGKIVVLCEATRDSFWPSPLRTAGARVAALNCVPESGERVFVADGHPDAVAELRRLLALERRKLIELRPAAKPLYLCGVHLGAHLLLPWIAGAVESLRASGFSRDEATRAVQAMGTTTLRAYGKAGPKAWKRAAAERLHHAIEQEIDAIRRTDPRLALLCTEGYEQTVNFFGGKFVGFLRVKPSGLSRAKGGGR